MRSSDTASNGRVENAAAKPRGNAAPVHLSPREKEIALLSAEGFSLLNIAEKLGISEKSVKNMRCAAYRKLGFHNVAQLARWAIREGFIAA